MQYNIDNHGISVTYGLSDVKTMYYIVYNIVSDIYQCASCPLSENSARFDVMLYATMFYNS